MANDSGFNMDDVKQNLASPYQGLPLTPWPLDLAPHGPGSLTRTSTEPAFHLPTETTDEAHSTRGDSAEAAKNRLAQEALLANPGETRTMFPQVLQEVGIHGNDHLNRLDIVAGLQNPNLPQNVKNYLTVLDKGYNQFTRVPNISSVGYDPAGVSAASLEMLDKAVNRSISDDPIYRHRVKFDLMEGAAFALFYGLVRRGSLATKLTLMAVGIPSTIATFEGIDWLKKGGTEENKMYDQVSTKYQSLVKNYPRLS